jgi:hypothetical protein
MKLYSEFGTCKLPTTKLSNGYFTVLVIKLTFLTCNATARSLPTFISARQLLDVLTN